ncbi:MAG: AAA family ATPase [Candidatus Anammoximicrobium sp.]|nr:AAA family ATPase [Candidatus Anammoximicrobium sp.]
MSKACEEQAIRFLRGEENPFDAFVVSDKPAQEFPQCHVQEVHGEQFEQIGRAIDKYRYPAYRTRRQLHETRVLIVRGVRGSGKTHLLHVLRQRATPTPEIWVCPRYYDPAFPFAEYVLTEFVRELLSAEDAEAPARLRWSARELTRQLLREAVASLSLPEWLEWSGSASDGWSRLRRARRSQADREALLDDLAAGRSLALLDEICGRHGLSSAAAAGLVTRHVERTELGSGSAVRMRREVLLAFGDLALRNTPDRLASLLEQDFAQPEAALPPARAEVVTQLLQTAAEVLAAVGVPIVFALDNMERLLAPRGPVDMPAAQSFFNGLAHFLDQTRGMLVVLFVERGLWNEFGPAINSFAEHRLRQGVRVRDYGCVWDLELTPPTPDQIERVVQRRMSPLLARAPQADQLPPCFPFASDEVRQIATAGVDVLRTALLRLRDRYDELVLPDHQQIQKTTEPESEASPPATADEAADALRRTWEEAAATGRRRLGMSRRTSLAQELHTGLGRWLELLLGQQVHGWRLSEARSAVTFGDHPAFGSVTLATWQDEQGRPCRVALGPILGEGRAMPRDLEIKLSALQQRPSLADQLVVLWPVQQGPIEAKQLPPATRQIWEQSAATRPVWLCPLPMTDFAWLLGLPEWLAQHSATASASESLCSFILERTSYLLADLTPRQSAEGLSAIGDRQSVQVTNDK